MFVYVDEKTKNNLGIYKYIYLCSYYSNSVPLITLERFPVVYINKKNVYIKKPSSYELKECWLSFTDNPEDLDYKLQIENIYNYNVNQDKLYYFFTNEPYKDIKEFIKKINSKLEENVEGKRKEALIRKFEGEQKRAKEEYDKLSFILEVLKEENKDKKKYSKCIHSQIDGTCSMEKCFFIGQESCLRYIEKIVNMNPAEKNN